MEAIEALGENLDDHDTIVNILKNNPESLHSGDGDAGGAGIRTMFPQKRGSAVVTFDNYIGAMEDLGAKHSTYMEELWQVMQVATTHNRALTVMNNVFIPPIQVTVTSRNHAEAAEGKPIQELATAWHVPDPQALPPNCTESTRVLAALLNFVLQREMGQRVTAAECATAFKCDADIMRQVVGPGGKRERRRRAKEGKEPNGNQVQPAGSRTRPEKEGEKHSEPWSKKTTMTMTKTRSREVE